MGNTPIDIGEVSSFNANTPKKNTSRSKDGRRSTPSKSNSIPANNSENNLLAVDVATGGAPAGYKKSLKLGTFSGQKSRRSNPSGEKKEQRHRKGQHSRLVNLDDDDVDDNQEESQEAQDLFNLVAGVDDENSPKSPEPVNLRPAGKKRKDSIGQLAKVNADDVDPSI